MPPSESAPAGQASSVAVERYRQPQRTTSWNVTAVQQVVSLALLLGAIVVAAAVALSGAPLLLALAGALAVPLVYHGLPLAIEFIVGAVLDRRPVGRLGPVAALRLWSIETWRAFTVFTFDPAWRSDFPEPAIRRDPQRPAVLLIHGYCCNRAVWRSWLGDGELGERWNIATVNLEPAIASIDSYAAQLDAAIARLLRASGARQVSLVCHSMGGLVARAYLRSHAHSHVRRVVTLGTPHHGTVFAHCARSDNALQMRRSCDFVTQLAQREEPTEFICFASQHDNLIVPRESQVLTCAEAVWFERVGHLEMTGDPTVLARLIDVIERP